MQTTKFKSLHLLLGISLIAYILISYATIRSDFGQLITLFGVLFGAYGLIWREIDVKDLKAYQIAIGAAILFRFVLVFSFPNLSDDVYRFIWDGRLLVNGLSPFSYLPIDFFNGNYTGSPINGINEALFTQLNSPEYFTIYPPVCQFFFYLGSWLFPNSLYGATVVMKGGLFGFECGSIYLIHHLLKHFQLPKKNTLLYALNPLVIVELSGNLHFEAAMIFFLLLAIWFLKDFNPKHKHNLPLYLSAIAMSLAINAKLLPLMLLPFFFWRLGWQKSFIYYSFVGIFTLIAYFPVLDTAILMHLLSSVELYFQKFEFNASFYYIFRKIGYWYIGWNMIAVIGANLAKATFIGIILLAIMEILLHYKNTKQLFSTHLALPQLTQLMLWAFLIYFALATIVHPWYICTLVALAVFGHFRFPIIWTAMAIVSYYTYRTTAYEESMLLVFVEYSVVYTYLLWELIGRKNQLQKTSRN